MCRAKDYEDIKMMDGFKYQGFILGNEREREQGGIGPPESFQQWVR